MADDVQGWDGPERRKGDVSSLATRVGTLTDEVHGLRADVRINRTATRILGVVVVAVVVLFILGGLQYFAGRRRDANNRNAARAASCQVLNQGIKRDSDAALGLIASSVRPGSSNYPTTEAARQQLQQQIDAYLATQKLDLIDCKSYVSDPEHVKYVKTNTKFTLPSLEELNKAAKAASTGG